MYRGIVMIFCFLNLVGTAIAASPDTVMTGTVFAYGHELEAPYVLEIVDGTLRVNGVQVYPDLGQYDREPPPSEKEISEWTKRTGPLYRKTWDMEARLKEEGRPAGEITAKIAEFVRQQEDLVDSITDVRSMGFMVHWKDGSEESFITYCPRREKQTKEEQLQNQLRAWRRDLESNSIVIVGELVCPRRRAAELEAAIGEARAATPEELDRWKVKVFGSRIARQFNDPWPLEEIR